MKKIIFILNAVLTITSVAYAKTTNEISIIKHSTCLVVTGDSFDEFIGGLKIDQEFIKGLLEKNGFIFSSPIKLPVYGDELKNKIFLTASGWKDRAYMFEDESFSINILAVDADNVKNLLMPQVMKEFKIGAFKSSKKQLKRAQEYLLTHLPICETTNP